MGSNSSSTPVSIACLAAMSAISLPATLQCDGHQSMLISSPIFKILPISLNIWSRMSCLVRLFPEVMLCTELRESVRITNFSSLFFLAHLSAIRIANSSGACCINRH